MQSSIRRPVRARWKEMTSPTHEALPRYVPYFSFANGLLCSCYCKFITNMNLLRARINLRITSASESRRYKKPLWRNDYDYLSSAFFYRNRHLTRRTVAFPNALVRLQEGGGQQRRGRLTLDLLGAHFRGCQITSIYSHCVLPYCMSFTKGIYSGVSNCCDCFSFVSSYILSVQILENNDFRRMRISACRHSAVPVIGCC